MDYPDLCSVRGHEHAKRGLEVAAAGQHTVALYTYHHGVSLDALARAYGSVLPVGTRCVEPRLILTVERVEALKPNLPPALPDSGPVFVLLEDADRLDPAFATFYPEVRPADSWLLATCYLGGVCGMAAHPREEDLLAFLCSFDLTVELPPLTDWDLRYRGAEPSARIRERVALAAGRAVPDRWTRDAETILESAVDQLALEDHEVLRIRSVSRTVARLALSPVVAVVHVAEAVQYKLRPRGLQEVSFGR